MTQRIHCLPVLAASLYFCFGCAAREVSPPRVASQPALVLPPAPAAAASPHRPEPQSTASLPAPIADSDCVFLESSARAVAQYREFLARAGTAQEYARAVKHSLEQIEDLQAEMEFVRSGMQHRAAHC